jgi:hypothetical protein
MMSNGEKHMIARLGALKSLLSKMIGTEREMLIREIEWQEKQLTSIK